MTDRIPSDLIRSMAADYEQRHGVPPTHIALPGQDIFDAVPLKNFLVPEDPAGRLLAVIDTRAANARAAKSVTAVLQLARRNGKAVLRAFLDDNAPEVVLRRCEVDREITRLHATTDAGECGICV